jgi:hypothetical protein
VGAGFCSRSIKVSFFLTCGFYQFWRENCGPISMSVACLWRGWTLVMTMMINRMVIGLVVGGGCGTPETLTGLEFSYLGRLGWIPWW